MEYKEKLGRIKEYILISSKIMGICVCIYFMKNREHYQVSWNVLNWLWPSLALEKLSAKYFTIYDAELSPLADSMHIKVYYWKLGLGIILSNFLDSFINSSLYVFVKVLCYKSCYYKI